MIEIKLLCFRRLSPFFQPVQKCFQDLLRARPSSLFILYGCISSSMAYLWSRSKYPVFAERSFVSCSLII